MLEEIARKRRTMTDGVSHRHRALVLTPMGPSPTVTGSAIGAVHFQALPMEPDPVSYSDTVLEQTARSDPGIGAVGMTGAT
jgi:hypothetical protein